MTILIILFFCFVGTIKQFFGVQQRRVWLGFFYLSKQCIVVVMTQYFELNSIEKASVFVASNQIIPTFLSIGERWMFSKYGINQTNRIPNSVLRYCSMHTNRIYNSGHMPITIAQLNTHLPQHCVCECNS